MINEHLTEICGISIADHIGRLCAPNIETLQVAEQAVHIVQTILRTGEAITGIEVGGQEVTAREFEAIKSAIECLLTRISIEQKKRPADLDENRQHRHLAGAALPSGRQSQARRPSKVSSALSSRVFRCAGHCSPSDPSTANLRKTTSTRARKSAPAIAASMAPAVNVLFHALVPMVNERASPGLVLPWGKQRKLAPGGITSASFTNGD